ncbi:unnamed protein product [Larinioides sclopetarius]|uniref:Cytochrome P450 n=1 Tax=Larinioides sclopetarius TaxID=280406 RepID=A0AAV1ZGL6_9ARAC
MWKSLEVRSCLQEGLFYNVPAKLLQKCGGLLGCMRWRKSKLKVFENLGIPGPTPHFLFGNIFELNRKGPQRCYREWITKYGRIVGFYHGMKPILLVGDPDLLKKIFIKDFQLFCNRPEGVPLRVHSILDYIIPASEIMDNLLVNLKGEHWKRVRSILSSTFSANKLKGMIPAVNQVCDSALSILQEKSAEGEAIDIQNILQRLTLDIISAQAFAMNVDSLNYPADPLFRSAKVIFDQPYSSKILFFGLENTRSPAMVDGCIGYRFREE